MSFSELVEFRLVGGTALALQSGHRRSEDIDLFDLIQITKNGSKWLTNNKECGN